MAKVSAASNHAAGTVKTGDLSRSWASKASWHSRRTRKQPGNQFNRVPASSSGRFRRTGAGRGGLGAGLGVHRRPAASPRARRDCAGVQMRELVHERRRAKAAEPRRQRDHPRAAAAAAARR